MQVNKAPERLGAQKVWIDADTGNETDDIYAIVRLLCEPSIDVVGLSSAHFNNPDLLVFELWNQYPTQNIRTVEISQDLNAEILRRMGLLSIPHPIGADRQIGRAWGGTEPRDSPAAEELIRVCRSLSADEKLDVLCLGALTNIASAALIDASILSRIRCFALGAGYDLTNKAWNKNEFNIRNDTNAFDHLLNTLAADLTMMPTNVARPYIFSRDETYARLKTAVPIQNMLKQRWEETNPQDEARVLWDLALVEAYLNPEFADIQSVLTPPENTQRSVALYTFIDVTALTEDFWRAIGGIAA